LDGFAVPAPAQVTQTVRRLPICHFCHLAILLHFHIADRPFSLTGSGGAGKYDQMTRGHRPRLRRVRPASSRPGGSDADGAVLVRQRQAFFKIDDDAGSTPAATPDRSRRCDRSPVRFPEWRDDWRVKFWSGSWRGRLEGRKHALSLVEGRRHFPAGSERRSSLFGGYRTGSDTRTDALPRPRATPTRLDQAPTLEAGQTPQASSTPNAVEHCVHLPPVSVARLNWQGYNFLRYGR